MRTVVAVYNMKGGVGKTTTAVNLAYLAAAGGHRSLLWDLDPQAASSFAFRVRPRVEGFGKKSLASGKTLAQAIKETDYKNLDVLPADFAYRKFDRLLDRVGHPERVVAELLDTLGCSYDVVFLDCPAGFSLLTEGIFAAAAAVLVPTIPTVLSLRTLARLAKFADRSDSPFEMAAFFSMVDRRKTLHRRASEWSAEHPGVFLAGQVPYASVVEQMAVLRMPLGVFAARDPATTGFAEIWAELQARLARRCEKSADPRPTWSQKLQAIESLIERLESTAGQHGTSRQAPAVDLGDSHWARRRLHVEGSRSRSARRDSGDSRPPEADSLGAGAADLVHSFDTERRDLQRGGHVLELRECRGRMFVVVARSGSNDEADMSRHALVQIDSSWALDILSGVMSPLAALERRLGRPGPSVVENVRAMIGGRRLQRVDSRVVPHAGSESRECLYA